MKTPRKVIEKISLPLMFVTFVMAVLVSAVSPVSAAPSCDGDGDGYYKVSGKRCDGDPNGAFFDPDDSDPCRPDPGASACDVEIYTEIYTAELTSGAFRFVDGGGNRIPPIYVITGSNKDIGVGPLFETDVEMLRPDCGLNWESGDDPIESYPTTKPDGTIITGPGPWANPDYENCTYVKKEVGGVSKWIPDWDAVAFDQEIWDRMFEIGCPELGTSVPVPEPGEEYKITSIISTDGDWDFSEPGNTRLILRDIRLDDSGGVKWDVTVQLIGKKDDPLNIYPDWLPDDSYPLHEFILKKGGMWGREVSGGGPGGRRSCHQADNGTDERIEGFYLLCNVEDEDAGTCGVYEDDAGVKMDIAFCDGDCRASIPDPDP